MKKKYIFVTGGVVSSLGKGITAAALGTLLEARGLKVTLMKFDPYLNVDPGTMNPYQHGEVYVLEDGAETDLDLGHYERFTSGKLTRKNNITSGQVYESVISKEREGKYLGKTVQVIPHITDEIKSHLYHITEQQPCDVVIVEIGGTTGDIEGLPFLEAIRQFCLEIGSENVLFLHLTLVLYLKAAGELKTKPTQQSVAKLREIGIQPHILVCRCEQPLSLDIRQKISMFCNVPLESVIEELDVSHSIYETPLMLHREGLDNRVCHYLGIEAPEPDLTAWQQFVQQVISPSRRSQVALVGKYTGYKDSYKSVCEALTHAAAMNDLGVDLVQIDAEIIEKEGPDKLLNTVDGILIPGGFGDRGVEGKIAAAHYARIKKIPYLGLCLGMQIAVIEFARHALGLKDADSAEFHPQTAHPIITLLDQQRLVTKKGGTMRLGLWPCKISPHTRTYEAYGKENVKERHRHRYEFNSQYRQQMQDQGLLVSGSSPDNKLVEIIELRDHPWFVGCQFHPEFRSKPLTPHPLFNGFLKAIVQKH